MTNPSATESDHALPEKTPGTSIPQEFRPRIPVIGIIGGIGSGKSSVAKWVAAQAGLRVIDADALGHAALREPHIIQALCEQFGTDIRSDDGQIVRSLLAKKVFGSSSNQLSARHELERIVHPEIKKKIVEEIAKAAGLGQSAVLLDAAVLLETGWKDQCDLIVFVQTPDSIRLKRVQENRGWTAEELQRREASQWSLARKQAAADLTVTNDRELDHAGRQLLEAFQQRGYVN